MFASRTVALTLLSCCFSFMAGAQSPTAGSGTPLAKVSRATIQKDYGRLPLAFEANQGQVDSQVRFTSRGDGYSLFLSDKEAILALTKGAAKKPHSLLAASAAQPRAGNQPKSDLVRMQLVGAENGLKVSGADRLPGTVNYFIGNDSAKWHSNVPTYRKVRYEGVYPGVDLVYYGNQRQLEYDFIVAPNADPKPIRLHFAGAKKLELNANGDLEIIASSGQVAFRKPVVYQEIEGKRKAVEGNFELLAKNDVSFTLGDYDRSKSVVIDPTLTYSTYLGGSSYEEALGIAVDGTGSVYVTGETFSTDFPVKNPYQAQNKASSGGASAVFVSKLSPDGSSLVYSTFLSGSGNGYGEGDGGSAIAVDASGSAYLTGLTFSSDFPLVNPYQSTNLAAANSLSSPFVAKLSASGSELVYSTYLGGSSNIYSGTDGDRGLGIATDASGYAYVTGATYSEDFPITSGALQKSNPAYLKNTTNVFVTKLAPAGNTLIYSTYIGGSGIVSSSTDPSSYYFGDGASSIAIDASGNAYLTGIASSVDFPVTAGAYQMVNHAEGTQSSNAFVAKLNATGSGLIYSTYLGGSSVVDPSETCLACHNGDGGSRVVIDSQGDAYVSGGAYSADFPTTSGALQRVNHAAPSQASNAFVVKLNPAGSALLYSTLLGGSGTQGDVAYGLAVDSAGNAYLTGFTSSSDFPVSASAFQSTNQGVANGVDNAFFAKLDPTGGELLYSTYVGGTGSTFPSGTTYQGDVAYGIALDSSSNAYITGATASFDFPITTGAFQRGDKTTLTGVPTAFVAKFGLVSGTVQAATTTSLTADTNPQTTGLPVVLTAYVQPTKGTGIPTGTIKFSVDGVTSDTTTLDNTGQAIYSTTTLTAGAHIVTAAYAGDSTYQASTGSLGEEIIDSSSGSSAATPVISPAGGSYASAQTVTITDATPGAMIYYAVYGSVSTPVTLYTGPFTVSSTGVVEAVAIASGYSESGVAIAAYEIAPTSGLQFIPVTPCRVADTRGAAGAFGSPELAAGASREFDLPQSACGIPSTAVAYSLNVTVLPATTLNYLTLWPSGTAQPNVSTLNSYDGRVKANAAVVPAGSNGGVDIFVSDASNVILDINGYFVPAGTSSSLAFYPLTPCRVADTRGASGPLAGPFLTGQTSRSFPVQSSACGIPSTAQAYSLNVTTIPHKTLNYLTTWPTGQAQPNVSTLNAPTGAVTANAAIVPAGTSGGVSLFASDDADVILDVNGYFAPAATGGLSLYSVTPCRVLDTRGLSGVFNGVLQAAVETSTCAVPAAAQAYVLNATVVPSGPLNYITLWPDGSSQPNVSTLNADDAAITSNMSIVPTSNGKIDAFSSNLTQLILDITSYFAP